MNSEKKIKSRGIVIYLKLFLLHMLSLCQNTREALCNYKKKLAGLCEHTDIGAVCSSRKVKAPQVVGGGSCLKGYVLRFS